VLRFWLDFGDGAEKRDCYVPRGRVFFTGSAWTEEERRRGTEAREKLEAELEEEAKRLRGAEEEYGKASPLRKLFRFREMVLTKTRKDNVDVKLRALDVMLPKGLERMTTKPGKFPTMDSDLRIEEGGLVCVKRSRKPFGDAVFHILGTWSARPVQIIDAL